MNSLVERQLTRLSEPASANAAGEGFSASMQISVFNQVLVAREVAITDLARVPFYIKVMYIDVPFEIELRVVGFVTVGSHTAIKRDQVF